MRTFKEKELFLGEIADEGWPGMKTAESKPNCLFQAIFRVMNCLFETGPCKTQVREARNNLARATASNLTTDGH